MPAIYRLSDARRFTRRFQSAWNAKNTRHSSGLDKGMSCLDNPAIHKAIPVGVERQEYKALLRIGQGHKLLIDSNILRDRLCVILPRFKNLKTLGTLSTTPGSRSSWHPFYHPGSRSSWLAVAALVHGCNEIHKSRPLLLLTSCQPS